MVEAYKKFWRNYAIFDGTSSRADYWWVFLVNSIIRITIIISFFIFNILTASASGIGVLAIKIVGVLFSLLIMIPVMTLTARRLRDIGTLVKLVYPLPAIYLMYAVMEFISFPGMIILLPIFLAYTTMLLLICTRKKDSLRKEKI